MPSPTETLYFEAVLTPNNSLTPRAFQVVVCVVGLASFFAGLAFWSMGALPVIGFLGVDAAALWVAFRSSRRTQSQETRISITAESIRMDHRSPAGDKKSAEVPTHFARVELDEPVTHNSWLRVEHGRKAFVIGRFLTPEERKSLAEALRAAIARAKRERFPA